MNRLTVALAQSLVVMAFFAVPSIRGDEEALKKDLTAVIALHGLPCGQVVAVKAQAENDYAASCKDGNKYRVYLNAEGRVVVEKQSKGPAGQVVEYRPAETVCSQGDPSETVLYIQHWSVKLSVLSREHERQFL